MKNNAVEAEYADAILALYNVGYLNKQNIISVAEFICDKLKEYPCCETSAELHEAEELDFIYSMYQEYKSSAEHNYSFGNFVILYRKTLNGVDNNV